MNKATEANVTGAKASVHDREIEDFLSSESAGGREDFDRMLPLASLLADLPARENRDDRQDRIDRTKITTRFALGLLAIAATYLAVTASLTEDALTRQWAQTLLAGLIGAVISYLFGARS